MTNGRIIGIIKINRKGVLKCDYKHLKVRKSFERKLNNPIIPLARDKPYYHFGIIYSFYKKMITEQEYFCFFVLIVDIPLGKE